jgi:hypothetical protein
MESALLKFVNIDGDHGKKVMPQPHDEFHNPEAATFDNLSVADRVKQIENDLSPDERTALLSFVLLCSCGTPENSSFYEFLHWWALCNHSYQYCIEYLIKYKFRGGQSSFAIKFFEEALSTGNLSYAFSSPVASVKNDPSSVQITTRDGQTFSGARLISTIPLNILNTVTFSPPLTTGKREAADVGHVNKCAKVHAEVRNPELRSWTGVTYPNNKLLYSIADGTTPAGNTHLVAFGADYNHLTPEKDIEETKKAVQNMADVDIHRLVSLLGTIQQSHQSPSLTKVAGLPQLGRRRVLQRRMVLPLPRLHHQIPLRPALPPRQRLLRQLRLGGRLAQFHRRRDRRRVAGGAGGAAGSSRERCEERGKRD